MVVVVVRKCMAFYNDFVLLFTSLSSLTPSTTGHSLRAGIIHLLRVRQCHVRGLRATTLLNKCILDAHPTYHDSE